MRLALAALAITTAAIGCTDHGKSTTNQPVLSGDTCALATDATTCAADPDCTWFGTGCACPPNDPSCTCPPGACGSIHGAGSGTGSGSTGAACACPNGAVCVEQIGGPAQPAGATPDITCVAPDPGTGDPCTRIPNEGTCHDSTTVGGLCVCDNGIR